MAEIPIRALAQGIHQEEIKYIHIYINTYIYIMHIHNV